MLYLKRLQELSQKLTALSCQAILIENPTNILYLTGLELSAGKLLVSPTESILIVDGRYIETARQLSPCPVYLADEMPLQKWVVEHAIERLAFESDKTTYHAYLNLEYIADELSKRRHFLVLQPIESPVVAMRMFKDEEEIIVLKESATLAYAGYEFVASKLKEGISEAELANDLEHFWRKQGARKSAFDPIIAFGPNGAMPHHRAGATVLEKNMVVLIDIGVTWKHYHSDMTRVIFFGNPPELAQQIYSIVEVAKKRALHLCRPGIPIRAIDDAARQFITSQGYGDQFMHSLGHGIGLDIHEPPTVRSTGGYSQKTLQPGMVLTIEPGIYLPGKFGVRLEDTILITPNGHENLTAP